MTALGTMLRERAEEFDTHFALAVSLEAQILSGDDIALGSLRLSARHLMTMKSGLLVHLYNILEAVMSQATKLVGSAFGDVPPSTWSVHARREWLREHGVARIDGEATRRLEQMERFSSKLLSNEPMGPQALRKPPGTWNDENIGLFAGRLGVELRIQPDLHRKMAEDDQLGEMRPLKFLAERRNDLAHGHRTFEDGCKDLLLSQIRQLADTVIEFMDLVATSFQDYIDQKKFVVAS